MSTIALLNAVIDTVGATLKQCGSIGISNVGYTCNNHQSDYAVDGQLSDYIQDSCSVVVSRVIDLNRGLLDNNNARSAFQC